MSKILIEDTRNPVAKHKNVHEWADANDIRIMRMKMRVGDYTLLDTMKVCVDTKSGLQEVYSNVVQEHRRFKAECELAKEVGIRLIILVEDGDIPDLAAVANWKNPRRERWFRVHNAHKAGKLKNVVIPKSPPVSSELLCQMMQTMAERYGCEWMFCSKEETGARIWELLHRDSVYSRINTGNLDGGK